MNTTLQVNEIFYSIQGEGMYSGIPATFIRLQGCPVQCSWCDTKYTWKKGGLAMTVDEIVQQIEVKSQLVVVTGGEPLMQDLSRLSQALKNYELYFQIETSGLYGWKPEYNAVDWHVTWSPKRNLYFRCEPSLLPEVDEVKFVIDSQTNWKEISDCLSIQPWWHNVTVMPEGCPPDEIARKAALAYLNLHHQLHSGVDLWRYSERLQYTLGVK